MDGKTSPQNVTLNRFIYFIYFACEVYGYIVTVQVYMHNRIHFKYTACMHDKKKTSNENVINLSEFFGRLLCIVCVYVCVSARIKINSLTLTIAMKDEIANASR